jgi:hypothetical protein
LRRRRSYVYKPPSVCGPGGPKLGVKYPLEMFRSEDAVPRTRIIVHKNDVLVVNGMEIDGEILKSIVNPDARLLWAFVKKGNDIQPVPYDETHCVWLTDEDLVRK